MFASGRSRHMALESTAMKILAIETSCECASVALLLDGRMLSCELQGHANHSERLLPTVSELLAEGGIAASGLDAIAFGAGPGAFTGLRLACGVAQGMAMAADIGVVPVSTLAALALQAERPAVLTVTDARMGEIYAAAYRVDSGEPQEVLAPCCVPPSEFALDGRWHVVGSALQGYPDLLPETVPGVLSRAPLLVPRAREVAALGALAVGRGACLPPEQAAPLYVRNKVALTTAERMARGGKA